MRNTHKKHLASFRKKKKITIIEATYGITNSMDMSPSANSGRW